MTLNGLAIVYRLFRPMFFALDPERAHRLVTRLFKWALSIGWLRRWLTRRNRVEGPELSQRLFGLTFPNPVGLAAGFDKNAELIDDMGSLGFGFIEVGTVTARPQAGNPTPRLFRLSRDRALINRLGFNNQGARRVARRLAKRSSSILLGVNIGRSKIASNNAAIDDYLACLDRVWPYADYITVNVSSPNTPELRALQARERLEPLLVAICDRLREVARAAERSPPPVLVKVAPDLDRDEVIDICELVQAHDISGVIAANTTVERTGLRTPGEQIERIGSGGLSGEPLTERMLAMVRCLRSQLGDRVPIVAVGGIASPESAWQALVAGARLIQLYTGLIYEGPSLVRKINRGLAQRIRERGLSGIGDVVGSRTEGGL